MLAAVRTYVTGTYWFVSISVGARRHCYSGCYHRQHGGRVVLTAAAVVRLPP